MKKNKFLLVSLVSIMVVTLIACNGDTNNETEELKELIVDFQLPESVSAGETIELKAVVTYGDEIVEDADEVTFEIWEQDDEENSIKIEANNNGDGSYTAETTFDTEGTYEMYAHTTARDLHTMPLESIEVTE
ncbi:FixH family protein [Oceanobacillus halophilus]|uniref:YtkA-like domain-containing protein n=1 Tax=Oceanobacillus halophilus TaxID=930130 RepID=A0A495A824_9BACI|nr:FixH family protein [Oceanobacillus halophilus]RKQ35545.1 hypothetical protein D8M06_04505 [Oceanobacillus halophilus]